MAQSRRRGRKGERKDGFPAGPSTRQRLRAMVRDPGNACVDVSVDFLKELATFRVVSGMRSPAKRSIHPNRHDTSVTLEDAFWHSLQDRSYP